MTTCCAKWNAGRRHEQVGGHTRGGVREEAADFKTVIVGTVGHHVEQIETVDGQVLYA